MKNSIQRVRANRQLLNAKDFTDRGVKFITNRPELGLLAELSEPLEGGDQRQLLAFMKTVNVLAKAKARSRAARGVA